MVDARPHPARGWLPKDHTRQNDQICLISTWDSPASARGLLAHEPWTHRAKSPNRARVSPATIRANIPETIRNATLTAAAAMAGAVRMAAHPCGSDSVSLIEDNDAMKSYCTTWKVAAETAPSGPFKWRAALVSAGTSKARAASD